MIEELLGNATWPLAVIVVILIVGITVFNVNESNRKDDVRVACVQAHGTLGEHNGWPTCTAAVAK